MSSLAKSNKYDIDDGNAVAGGSGGISDVTRMKREKEFQAVKLHSLESHGQSFFQIVIQVYFLFLLLILGTGTVIAGVSADKFFHDICKT